MLGPLERLTSVGPSTGKKQIISSLIHSSEDREVVTGTLCSLEYHMMDTDKKLSNSECCTPLSEAFRMVSLIQFKLPIIEIPGLENRD
jgi:hypothetical protein